MADKPLVIKQFPVHLNIGIVRSSDSEDGVAPVRIMMKAGRRTLIEVTMTAEAFALCLLGLSEQPATAELRDIFDSIEGVTPEWHARQLANPPVRYTQNRRDK